MWTIALCSLVLAFIVALDVGWRYIKRNKYHASYPLPPGPPGLPFFGNIIGINPDGPWLTYAEWAKTYGDLIYTRILGKEVIIINFETVTKDLLENRSSNYSDRPFLITGEMCGISFSSGLKSYGDQWRLHRRFFHQTFQNDAVNFYLYSTARLVNTFDGYLRAQTNSPTMFLSAYTTSIILNSVYDYDPMSSNDELVEMAAKALEIVLPASHADIAFILEAFPMILKLPSWLPGMSFKREMDVARKLAKKYVEQPFQHSLRNMKNDGSTSASMVYDAMHKVEEKESLVDENWMEALKEAAATGFIAETSNVVIMTFYLMMTLHPEAQEKAEAQIDAVVGRKRLPSIRDRPSLPYVDAILRETLRCNPVVPLSLPHATVDDDVYAGFHIPKRAVILPNLWSMGHDESNYPNPNKFIPERFLNEDDDKVENIAYGFGRRMCAGRHFADTSIWSMIAEVLAIFTISKAKDENGVEIPAELKFTNGLASRPLLFRNRIVPRTPGMDMQTLKQLIQASDA